MTEASDIGKYHILTELGRGGFAVTYRAYDRDLDREVALKILKPGWLDDAIAVERFLREARVAAKLHHPHIASIYDVGQAEGRLFIAMHLVEGRPLDRLLRKDGPLPWAKALQLLGDMAAALDYAHARGLVHRDVKPANIVVSDEEGAVLTDFGLMKAAQSASTTSANLTGASTPGTSAYIAPEIWSGQLATPASDLYAFAAVAGEILSGQSLFAADTLEAVIARHLALGPNWPSTWPPDVPLSAQDVIARGLERDPNKRWPSAFEFVSALRQTTVPTPTPVAKVVMAEQLIPPARSVQQSKWLKIAGAAGGILLVLVALLAIASAQSTSSGVNVTPTSTATAALTRTSSPTDLVVSTATATATLVNASTATPSVTSTTTPTPTLTLTATLTPTLILKPTLARTLRPQPSDTPMPTPTVVCPNGQFWNPVMNRCQNESNPNPQPTSPPR